MAKKKKTTRIQWNEPSNFVCVHLINHGLHGETIAQATGLSVSQVYYRARRNGLRLRGYRDGTGPVAQTILRKFTVRNKMNREQSDLQVAIVPAIEKNIGI